MVGIVRCLYANICESVSSDRPSHSRKGPPVIVLMHLKVQGKIAKRRQVPDKFQDKACRAKQAPRTLTLSCCPSNGTELHSNRCCSCSTLTWRRDEGEDGRVGGGGDSKTSETKHRSSPALLLKKTITGSMQYNRTARNRSTLRHSLMLCQVFALAPMGGIHVAGGAGSVEPGPPEAVSPSACARKNSGVSRRSCSRDWQWPDCAALPGYSLQASYIDVAHHFRAW